MALRVLLGDESSTIKKVFQLALQDFAVEVRPVNIGVDVVTVATAFQPDIIFIDVLLQKKNGYDVSSELKRHDTLKHIPVVLMWSGFMELDEDKLQASMANAQLEKPFDVTALRRLVTDLVPRTNTQRISQFLSFPKMPELEEKAQPPPVPPAATEPAEVEEDFQQISIPKMKTAQEGKFRLNMNAEDLDPEAVPVDYNMPSDKIDIEEIFKNSELGPQSDDSDEFTVRDKRKGPPAPPPPAMKAATPPALPRETQSDLEIEDLSNVPTSVHQSPPARTAPSVPTPSPLTSASVASAQPPAPVALSPEQLEKIIREQSAEVIESVVWKVIPELAAQIIERELNKLLKERDSHPF